jgi:hypothetical protein
VDFSRWTDCTKDKGLEKRVALSDVLYGCVQEGLEHLLEQSVALKWLAAGVSWLLHCTGY